MAPPNTDGIINGLVTVFANRAHPDKFVTVSAPGYPQLFPIMFLHPDRFLASIEFVPRHCTCALNLFQQHDKFRSSISFVPRHSTSKPASQYDGKNTCHGSFDCGLLIFPEQPRDPAPRPTLSHQHPHNYTAGPLAVMVCLADNDPETEVDAVIKMEVGPPQVLYRRDLQNAPRCFLSDWEVLNGMGKKSC